MTELDDELLNLAVVACEGYRVVEGALEIGEAIVANEIVAFWRDGVIVIAGLKGGTERWNPREDWGQGGPIIEREMLMIKPSFSARPDSSSVVNAREWKAFVLGPNNLDDNFEQRGPTPLIAAMRCYVASRHGETMTRGPSSPSSSRS